MRKRHAFRPTAFDVLEDRVVLSEAGARLLGAAEILASRRPSVGHRQSLPASSSLADQQTVSAEQAAGPTLFDPSLMVRTLVRGLSSPTSMAFLPSGRRRTDVLVLEKETGRVLRFVNGQPRGAVLDLPVNYASERGLLGIALHPRFPRNRGVYLYWTESSTGADSNVLAEVGNPNSPFPPGTPQPLGNRVDRFVWNRRTQALAFDRNIVTLRAFQADGAPLGPGAPPQGDEGQPARGNHNGGVIRFGRDGKLYIIIGDTGRRGLMQNLLLGPTPPLPDDQFGGPQPDDNHLTGVVLRLNADGTTPRDNPFFNLGATLGPEVGENLQKVFAYGVRNSFGLDIDPRTGALWESENGDDAFDEINRIEPGHNGGWIQFMGPAGRVAQFKEIESTFPNPNAAATQGLQQLRWPPARIADTPAEGLGRLVALPGSGYRDPELSWKFGVAPAAIGFLNSRALGRRLAGDLFVGEARTTLAGGYLLRFDLSRDRRSLLLDNPGLADRVDDNSAKFTLNESSGTLFGANFGVVTDIRTGTNGNLFLVSLSDGAIYEIARARPGS